MVFWQTDENDQPAMVTEPYKKAFTAANIKKEQEFYDSDLTFRMRLPEPENGRTASIEFTLGPEDSFARRYEKEVRKAFKDEIDVITKEIADAKAKNKAVKRFIDCPFNGSGVDPPPLCEGR